MSLINLLNPIFSPSSGGFLRKGMRSLVNQAEARMQVAIKTEA